VTAAVADTVPTTGDLAYRAMRTPLLAAERERELIGRWQSAGDRGALDELVLAHLRMVVAQAHRYRGYGMSVSDLVQEGSIGLMKAAARFDLERDVRFSTYAIWWIRAEIQNYIMRNWSVVRMGGTRAEKRMFFNLRRLRSRLERDAGALSGSELTQQLADAFDVAPEVVASIERRLVSRDRSSNEPIGDGADAELQDAIADDRPDPEERAMKRLDGDAGVRRLQAAIAGLPDRERMIVRRRHLAEPGETLEAVSRDLGVSKERVRQLERRALLRIRAALEDVAGDLFPLN